MFPVHTRRNLALSLVLAISLVGVSYGAGSILPGDGLSESTAYLIEDLADFDVFAGDFFYWASGVYTKLTCDIDLTGRSYPIAVIASEGVDVTWRFDDIPFEGIFDGNGHIIRNLTIDTLNADKDFLGLFGGIRGSGAQVKNLGIENVNITGGNSSYYLGGLCGENGEGTITNCHTTGLVISGVSSWYSGGLCGNNDEGTISDCYATGLVNGGGSLGGLCGENYYGEIANCYATNAVAGGDNSYYVGGLCGENAGTITNCYAAGSVTSGDNSYSLGGLCGENWYGTITNCYATGAVTGGADFDYIGGLCGYNLEGTITNCYGAGSVTGGVGSRLLGGLCGYNYDYEGTITNCYATGSVTGGAGSYYIGGLCGENDYGAITNCYATGSVTGDDYIGGLCGYNSSGPIIDCFWDTETSGMSTSDGGTGKTTAEMQIRSTFTNEGWDFVGEDVNGTDDFWRMCVDGIDYPKLSWWLIAGDFVCPDGVDLIDFAVLAETWSLSSGQTGYNDLCDLMDNDTIDLNDLAVFVENWLIGKK